MSWGIKIMVLYIGFVILIVTMVTMAMKQKIDLVSKDYYEQELNYQGKINKINRTGELENQLTWEMQEGKLIVRFPEQFKGLKVSGSIYFFRPSDASMDKTIALPTDTTGFQTITTSQLQKGIYEMQVDWQADDKEYYNEGIVQIN
jgi:hypothetical protein